MGRMLGAFDNPQELDRPDLNKCPDCECYFAGDNCPLCGKECPPEMRAGNRKPPKKQKRRRSSGNSRVTFVEWYHSWWFIILALFIFPLAGIALLITSPHKKSSKITFVVIGVAFFLISTVGLTAVIGMISNLVNPPVDTSLSRDEYIQRCDNMSAEQYFRASDVYEDSFVSVKLTVVEIITDSDAYYTDDKYPVYYLCAAADGGEFRILVRNCVQDAGKNLIVGDTVKFYGEGAGMCTIYALNEKTYSAPCINAAYVEIQK